MEEPQEYKTPKALLVAVIGMGVLIVVGVVVLAGVLIHRMSSKPAPLAFRLLHYRTLHQQPASPQHMLRYLQVSSC